MPIPLLLCDKFLYGNRSSDQTFESLLEELLKTFRELKIANNPNESYLDLLKHSCTKESIGLAKESSNAL